VPQVTRNEIINKDNQKLSIHLVSGGAPIIPSELHFSLYELNSPEKVLSPIKIFPVGSDRYPVNVFTSISSGGDKIADGHYLAQCQIPHEASLGRMKIKWEYKLDPSHTFQSFEEEFEVIDYLEVYGSDGPPAVSIADIRTFLRDKPEHHVLIDNYLFSNNDIMTASRYVVSRFNDIPPDVGAATISTFPSKGILLMGIAAWLFDSEANAQLMEQLTYQDGNIHHGISDKTQLYRQVSDRYWAQFDTLAADLKIKINVNQVYGGQGVGIAFNYYTGYGR
jgi:hypothetical protein